MPTGLGLGGSSTLAACCLAAIDACLGTPVDPATGERLAERPADAPVLYDAADLTTHAAIIGMTGSGKTGLGIGMIEEAAMDNVPVIAIDPKGDLGNLMLTFPQFRCEDFEPWVDAGAAQLRVLMCAACSRSDDRQRCGITGRDATRSHGCPLGKWDACPGTPAGMVCAGGGLTRWPTFGGRLPAWLRITWCGSPMPLRMWWAYRTGRALAEQPGCGCVRRAKVVWSWMKKSIPGLSRMADRLPTPDWPGLALAARGSLMFRQETIGSFEIDGGSLHAGRSVDLLLGGEAPERVRIDVTGAPSFSGTLLCEDETGGQPRGNSSPKTAQGDSPNGSAVKTIEINHTDEGQVERIRLRPSVVVGGEHWRIQISAWYRR